MHSQPEVDESLANKKTTVILFYNYTKSGVDKVDRMVRTYSCKRMTLRTAGNFVLQHECRERYQRIYCLSSLKR